MARRRRRSGTHRAVDVTIDVPQGVVIPRTVVAVPPRPYPPRTAQRIELRDPKKTVKRRVRVIIPKRMRAARKAYVMWRPGQLTIYGQRATERILADEYNRRRRSEIKSRRRRYSTGQLASVGSDRLGLLGAGVRAGRSARELEDAAMVARAILRGRT